MGERRTDYSDRPVWARRSQSGAGQYVEVLIDLSDIDGGPSLVTPGQAKRFARELWAAADDVERSNAPMSWWHRLLWRLGLRDDNPSSVTS